MLFALFALFSSILLNVYEKIKKGKGKVPEVLYRYLYENVLPTQYNLCIFIFIPFGKTAYASSAHSTFCTVMYRERFRQVLVTVQKRPKVEAYGWEQGKLM